MPWCDGEARPPHGRDEMRSGLVVSAAPCRSTADRTVFRRTPNWQANLRHASLGFPETSTSLATSAFKLSGTPGPRFLRILLGMQVGSGRLSCRPGPAKYAALPRLRSLQHAESLIWSPDPTFPSIYIWQRNGNVSHAQGVFFGPWSRFCFRLMLSKRDFSFAQRRLVR